MWKSLRQKKTNSCYHTYSFSDVPHAITNCQHNSRTKNSQNMSVHDNISNSTFNPLVIDPNTIAATRHRIRNRLLNTCRQDIAQSLSWIILIQFVHIRRHITNRHPSRTSVQLCLHQQPISPRLWHTAISRRRFQLSILCLDTESFTSVMGLQKLIMCVSPSPWQWRCDSAFVCPVTRLATTRARTMEPPPGQHSRDATPCHCEISRNKIAAAILMNEFLVLYSDKSKCIQWENPNPVLFEEVRHFAVTTMKRDLHSQCACKYVDMILEKS